MLPTLPKLTALSIVTPGVLMACGLSACGDGRHFERDGESSGSSGSSPTRTSNAGPDVSEGALEVSDLWSEGLDLEVSGLRWAPEGEAGELELLVGAVDPQTRAPLEGLDGRAFSFAEDGQDLGAEVLYEVSKEQNLRVALVLDLSRSMLAADAVEPLQTAARALLDAVPSGTRVALVRFATGYELVEEFTGDLSSLASEVESLEPFDDRTGQFTNLWGALEYTGSLFEEASDDAVDGEGRVVVAFTDGRDNVAESDVEGARISLNDAGAVVYTVGLGEDLDREGLASLSGESRFTETSRPQDLGPIFNDIGRRLGQLLRLRYTTPKQHGRHSVAVTLTSPDGRQKGGFTVTFNLD